MSSAASKEETAITGSPPKAIPVCEVRASSWSLSPTVIDGSGVKVAGCEDGSTMTGGAGRGCVSDVADGFADAPGGMVAMKTWSWSEGSTMEGTVGTYVGVAGAGSFLLGVADRSVENGSIVLVETGIDSSALPSLTSDTVDGSFLLEPLL